MKIVRIWLLVCLAALLPIRGAVAAAMLCAAGNAVTQTDVRSASHCDHHDAAGPSAMQPSGSGDFHDGHEPGTPGKCNLCSASCSLTPLVSETPKLPEPAPLPGLKFADFPAPVPSFLSDAQERPPRSA